MTDINIFDLKELAERLGMHYNTVDVDSYTSPCNFCGEQVGQNVSECECCGIPVVWKNSKAWKNLYGSPVQAIRLLTQPVPEDDDDLGRSLLDKLGRTGFANISQLRRWNKARRNISEDRLQGMITHVLEKSNKRGAMSHLLNWTDKAIREAKPKSKKVPQKGVPQVPSMPGG